MYQEKDHNKLWEKPMKLN